MGMEIHAAMAVLNTLNTIDQVFVLFNIDLNNHLISLLLRLISSLAGLLIYELQISVLCQWTKHSTENVLIYWNNPC